MRYYLADNKPVPITNVTIGGMRISNPPDALLETNNIGYTLRHIDPPAITETQKLEHSYAAYGGEIVDVWTIADKTAQELIDMYTAQIVENLQQRGRV